MSSHVKPPFTPEQVQSINDFQESGVWHPFTCPRDHHPASRDLVATVAGMVCPLCDYTQNWVHDFMADGSWRRKGVTIAGR